MKKIRKGKKMLLILLALAVVILAIVLIVNLVNKEPETPENPYENLAVPLPETTYSDMQVRNIVMEYLQDQNKTMVSMEIDNTTSNKVENDKFTAMLINAEGEVIGQLPTSIQTLGPGEQYKVQVILSGDLTATTQIKLVKE